MKEIFLILFIVCIAFFSHVSYGTTSINPVSVGYLEQYYCKLNGDCEFNNLIVWNLSVMGSFLNITVTEIHINSTLIEGLNGSIEGFGNNTFLRIDTLNDPLTGNLDGENASFYNITARNLLYSKGDIITEDDIVIDRDDATDISYRFLRNGDKQWKFFSKAGSGDDFNIARYIGGVWVDDVMQIEKTDGDVLFLYNVTANQFFGLFNWWITPGVSTEYLEFNKSHLSFDESKLNETISNLGSDIFFQLDAGNSPVTAGFEVLGIVQAVIGTDVSFPAVPTGTAFIARNNLNVNDDAYIVLLGGTAGEAGHSYQPGSNVTKVYYDRNDDTFKFQIDQNEIVRLTKDTLTVVDTGTAGSGLVVPKLWVDTLTLSGNDITDSTGEIDFKNEHLMTTGDITAKGFNGTLNGNVNGGNGSFDILDMSNTTVSVGQITQEGIRLLHTFVPTDQHPSYQNLFIGLGAGGFGMNNVAQPYLGTGNVGIGANTLTSLTTGYYNFAIGSGNLASCTSCDSNLAIGHFVGDSITTGDDNVLIGRGVGNDMNAGHENTIIGAGSGDELTSGSRNTIIGARSMTASGTTVSDNVVIGYESNIYETGSHRLAIDNQDRGTLALTKTNAMFYGYFAATPETQNTSINANVNISQGLNVVKNFTGNQIYGGMRNFTDAGWTLPIGMSSTYYNITGLEPYELNGFLFISEGAYNSSLNTTVAGLYDIRAEASLKSSTAGGEYGFTIRQNYDNPEAIGDCYKRFDATGSYQSISINVCIRRLAIGDLINLAIDDEAGAPKDATFKVVKLFAMRIGD